MARVLPFLIVCALFFQEHPAAGPPGEPEIISFPSPYPVFYVNAARGLYLRARPGKKGEIIALVPHKSAVRVMAATAAYETIDNRYSHWYFVSWGKKEGWCFGGYLVEDRSDLPFTIRTVFLACAKKNVGARVLLQQPVFHIATGNSVVAFIGRRGVWYKRRNGPVAPVETLFDIGEKPYNWYENALFVGDTLLLSVQHYPEEKRVSELEKERGEFVAGPRPVGVLVLDFATKRCELIRRFRIASSLLPAEETSFFKVDSFITVAPQCFFTDGGTVYVGTYDFLGTIDIGNREVRLLEGGAMSYNRLAITRHRGELYWTADEGGMGGTWLASMRRIYRVMNDGFAMPDSPVSYNKKLLVSTRYGLVEIDAARETYVIYRCPGLIKRGIFNLKVVRGRLFACRTDEPALVSWGPNERRLTSISLRGVRATTPLYDIGYFDAWYATDRHRVYRLEEEP